MLSMKWRMVLFSLPLLFVVGYAHLYLYRRMVVPLIARPAFRKAILGFALALLALGLLGRFLAQWLDPETSRPLALVAIVWTGFLLYLLLLTVVTHGGLGFVWKRRPTLASPERRALLLAGARAGSLVVAGGLSTYGTWRAFMPPELTETVLPVRGLPRELEGFSIVQLTDVHVGPVIQTAFLDELVRIANAARPDLTVITGDLVDGRVERLGDFVRRLSLLRARWGVHFITGNHDYYSGANAWTAFVASLGINVLRNRSMLVGDAGASLRLIGVDDWSAPRFGEPGYDLDAALRDVRVHDEATVLLAHQPANFDEVVARGIGVQLSGHTHGGQFFPATLGAAAIWGSRSRGLTTLDGSHLYVSRGCGFVGPPFRVGSAPEIAKLVLVRG